MTRLFGRREFLGFMGGAGACAPFLLSADSAWSTTAPAPIRCFSPHSIDAVTPAGLGVFMQAPPPMRDGDPAYPYYPLTAAATQNIRAGINSTWTGGKVYHWIWQMRAQGGWNNRPNQTFPKIVTASGVEARIAYSSHAKAIAATEVQLMYSAGFQERGDATLDGHGYLDVAEAAGFAAADVVPVGVMTASREAVFADSTPSSTGVYRTARDKIYLTDGRLADCRIGRGFVLDAEAQDGRSPALLLAQIQRLAAIAGAKGYDLVVYPNQLNHVGAIQTGFAASNLPQILSIPNVTICIMAWSMNQEHNLSLALDDQLRLLGKGGGGPALDMRRVQLTVGLGTATAALTAADAAVLRQRLLADGYGSVGFWRDNAIQGAACGNAVNQVIGGVLGLSG